MTKNELMEALIGFGGANVRTGKTNFIAIPTGDAEQPYIGVKVTELLAKDTKSHSAFDFEAAKREYDLYQREAEVKAAERAAKPKAVKGPNPEAQARRDALDAAIKALPAFATATATEVLNMLPESAQPQSGIPSAQVGASLKRLVEAGEIVMTNSDDPKDRKPYYTKG